MRGNPASALSGQVTGPSVVPVCPFLRWADTASVLCRADGTGAAAAMRSGDCHSVSARYIVAAMLTALVLRHLPLECEGRKLESSHTLALPGSRSQVQLGHFRAFSTEGCLMPSRWARPLHLCVNGRHMNNACEA